MSKLTKGTPVTAKTNAQEAPVSDIAGIDFEDQLALDPKVIADIKAQKMAYRWINAAKFKANFGYDSRRWQPYKKSGAIENNSFGYADPEGYIRRGDLILAVRPLSVQNAYKQRNANRIANLAGNAKKAAVEGIKQSFKDAGIERDSKVIEGYEENE